MLTCSLLLLSRLAFLLSPKMAKNNDDDVMPANTAVRPSSCRRKQEAADRCARHAQRPRPVVVPLPRRPRRRRPRPRGPRVCGKGWWWWQVANRTVRRGRCRRRRRDPLFLPQGEDRRSPQAGQSVDQEGDEALVPRGEREGGVVPGCARTGWGARGVWCRFG